MRNLEGYQVTILDHPYFTKNFAYVGWRKLAVKGSRHYFREALSLCRTNRLFADSLDLEGGKACVQCLRLRAAEKRKAA